MKSNKRFPKSKHLPFDDKVVVSSEFFEDTTPSYICSICNQTLIRLTDSSMQNTAFWCRHCSIEWDPAEENIRRESKLSVPDRNEETLVSNTPGIPDISIHKEPELSGGFRELAKKGIKITKYDENIPRRTTKR